MLFRTYLRHKSLISDAKKEQKIINEQFISTGAGNKQLELA